MAAGLVMTTKERLALIAALEVYARWLRFDLDNPRPEQVERARGEVMRLLPGLTATLRDFTEDDIALMLHRAHISLPITTPAEALELIQRAVDVASGEDDAAEFQDGQNVKAGKYKI